MSRGIHKQLNGNLPATGAFDGIFDIEIDRPIGTRHEKNGHSFVYPINYGEIKSIPGGDGEPQDVYVLGVTEPIKTFRGRMIAIIHRLDDVEDKWVTCPEGMDYTSEEILAAVDFEERYHTVALILPD